MKKIVVYTSSLLLLAACNASKKGSDSKVETASSSKDGGNSLYSIDLKNMDNNIKPNDDFFMYSNGTWVKNNPVPSNESRWGSFDELEQNNNKKLTDILLKSTQASGTMKNVIGNYYSSFMNTEKRNELGYEPIKADLERISQLRNKGMISTIVADFHRNGVGTLFGFGVDQDLKNVQKNSVYWGQGGLGLPNRDYYFKENKKELLDKYEKHIASMFLLIGIDSSNVAQKAKNVVLFEKEMASAMMTPAEQRIPENSYNPKKIDECYTTLKDFDFESYVQKTGIYAFDTLIVAQPKYMEKINSMMKEQSMQAWKDYLYWCILNHYAGHLSDPFVKQNFAFYGTALKGVNEMKPNSDLVIDEITGMEIGELLGKYFVEAHFSPKAQQRVNEMVDNLLAVFAKRIENSTWMSDVTKKEALHKLKSIGRKLGSPTEYKNFDHINLDPNQYVQNLRVLSENAYKNNLAKLSKPVDKKEWGMPAHMVNAYYHPLLNEIAFPAGIMQAPFFDENAEDAVNYGRIGMVIGHEFTHGFDDTGAKFAADGSFKNWWSDEDKKKFEERTKILGETFANFCPIEGHCVNPELTMGENIADLGGLTMAYYAYAMTEEFKSGKKVDGFSPAQRFFIAYAQLWKINYTPEELKNRIANDPHSPGMFRVNGPLMNCPEFFAAFNIKEGDKMRNSALKIANIW